MALTSGQNKRFSSEYFATLNITTVRMETSRTLLSAKLLDRLQQPLGIWTTRLGRFSYTNFTIWQEAYQYYCIFDRYKYKDDVLRTYPVYHPNMSYADYMEELGQDTTYFELPILHVPSSTRLEEICPDLLLPNYPLPIRRYYTEFYVRP